MSSTKLRKCSRSSTTTRNEPAAYARRASLRARLVRRAPWTCAATQRWHPQLRTRARRDTRSLDRAGLGPCRHRDVLVPSIASPPFCFTTRYLDTIDLQRFEKH